MTIRLVFHHDYEVSVLGELPEGGRSADRFYFPSGSEDGGRDGLIVDVTPRAGRSWHGIFEFGNVDRRGLTGVFSHPDPRSMVVVSAGQGIQVRTDDPKIWSRLPTFPVTNVLELAEQGLLLVSDYTTVAAYATQGLKWRTRRLSWDGVELGLVKGTWINGCGWDPTGRGKVDFVIDLESGDHRGGISPDPLER